MFLQYKSFENTVGKGEIAHNKQFLLLPLCFELFQRNFYHSEQFKICRLRTLSFWKSLKFVIWERVEVLGFCMSDLGPDTKESEYTQE